MEIAFSLYILNRALTLRTAANTDGYNCDQTLMASSYQSQFPIVIIETESDVNNNNNRVGDVVASEKNMRRRKQWKVDCFKFTTFTLFYHKMVSLSYHGS